MRRYGVSANNQGFTLVELMVVVAIIGILAAVAIPGYGKFQARARQSEAKIALAGMYTAEKSYAADAGTFNACLVRIGYEVPNATNVARRYYNAGFDAPGANCGADGTVACNAIPSYSCTAGANNTYFAATAMATGSSPATLTNTSINTGSFNIMAIGKVSADAAANFDTWTIDETKSLNNTQVGI
jgi:type IV pilus assembly protein PilA